jgi:hypothetical protein
MIKKPTLFVLLCAIILGVAVYYFDYRKSLNPKPATDTEKLAFTLQPSDISSLTLSWPAKPALPPVHFEQKDGNWQILRPIETGADQAVVSGIANSLSTARISQTEPGSSDRLKAYGLDTPEVSLDFQLRNGSKHSVLLGNKDFTGIYAYAVIDGAKTVSLLPETLLTTTDKSLDDFRDHTVLHIPVEDVVSLDLKNHSGELAISKEKDDWKFTKPSGPLADTDNVNTLVSAVSNAKFTGVASEKPDHLAKYGLASPAITYSAENAKGEKFTLAVGKKEGNEYYARDASRPMIFKIDDTVFQKLSDTFADLRDLKLLHFDTNAIDHITLHNPDGDIELARKSSDEWTVNSPANLKGKSASVWKIFSPLTDARADQVIDHPPAGLAAKLAKPAVEVNLAEKGGAKIEVRISAASGDFVYVRSSASPALYKLKKQTLDDLTFKPSDIAF